MHVLRIRVLPPLGADHEHDICCACGPVTDRDVPAELIDTLTRGVLVERDGDGDFRPRYETIRVPRMTMEIQDGIILHVTEKKQDSWDTRDYYIHCEFTVEPYTLTMADAELVVLSRRSLLGPIVDAKHQVAAWQVVWVPICDDLKRMVFGFLAQV